MHGLKDLKEKPHTGQDVGFKGIKKASGAILLKTAEPCKAESTLIAQLALAGHAVHRLADGGYLCSKWGYTYQAADFSELRAFAARLNVIREVSP